MKLDILIPVAEKGGVENVINETATFLLSRGWEIRVVQLVWEGTRWTSDKIPFFPLIHGRAGHDLEEFVKAYKGFLDENGIPEIILATAWPYASYIAKQACLELNKDIPVCSWLHTLLSQYQKAGYGDFLAINYSDAHFAISRAIKNEIQSQTPRGPVFRINNPVDINHIPLLERSPEDSPKNLVFVGRLSIEKHPEVMLEALKYTRDKWILHFYGSGEKKYEQSLLTIAKQLGINSKVIFHGWQTEPWKNIKKADALVLASEYEGFPLSAIEANAAGIPVISSAFPGVDELIVPGKNGYIFEKNNPRELGDILNAISEGLLPACDAKDCKDKSLNYEKSRVLLDFDIKLKAILYQRDQILISNGSDAILYGNDKISVIIPCYNVEKYIRACLDSVINQSLPKEYYEIICLNDASSDGTLDILMEYEEQFPELIMVINLEQNSGQGALRNLGTYNYAGGNYIVYVDSDDIIDKNHLQALYESICLYESDFSMAGYYKFNESLREDIPYKEGFFNMENPSSKKEFILFNGVNNSPVSKIYKKSFIVENNIMFPQGIYMEDIFFYQRAMMLAKSIHVLRECIYGYRFNQNSTMNEATKKYNRQLDIYKVQKMSLNNLISEGLLDGYYEEFALTYYVRAFVSLLPEATIESVDEERKAVFKNIKKETLEVFPDFFNNPYINADKSPYNQDLIRYFKSL